MCDPCLPQQKKNIVIIITFSFPPQPENSYIYFDYAPSSSELLCASPTLYNVNKVEYSQNGYNGLFSSDVYLGAAVVV